MEFAIEVDFNAEVDEALKDVEVDVKLDAAVVEVKSELECME